MVPELVEGLEADVGQSLPLTALTRPDLLPQTARPARRFLDQPGRLTPGPPNGLELRWNEKAGPSINVLHRVGRKSTCHLRR